MRSTHTPATTSHLVALFFLPSTPLTEGRAGLLFPRVVSLVSAANIPPHPVGNPQIYGTLPVRHGASSP